ncbi:MAG: DUF4249 domain-containing protein [Cyclobacteriaceae bacterium]|nr:DUF4249 domain-containing protein [Cyclobacteriaceae bacterium]
MRNLRFITWLFAFGSIGACVERIEFDAPVAQGIIVIEGSVTDGLPPYAVQITRAFPIDAESTNRPAVSNATVTLFDDSGNEEVLTEAEPGLYKTNGLIQGSVNHSYFIRVRTSDGQVFESEPDRINPVGEIRDIRYEFEARTKVETHGEADANVFNIYVDATAGDAQEKYIRWRYTGTYEVITSPELHMTWYPPYTAFKDPWPCSGYILVGGPPNSGGVLVQVGECECCTCWVTVPEVLPQLSDTQLISGNEFKNVKVGEVPVNNTTFYHKFKVEVEQMSLTRNVYDFFKLVREQKENASSIFQPPSGEIRGNIRAINTNEPVVGLFWATSVRKRVIYLFPEDVPLNLTPIDFNTLPCNEFHKNSTTKRPEGW